MKGKKGFQKGHRHSVETKQKISQKHSRKIVFHCDNCGKESCDRPSHYNKKKRHFCSSKCYGLFRKYIPTEEQNNYKGIRKTGESKQIYHRRYCKKNPERIAHLKARRYARKKGAEGNHTLEEWENLKEVYEYKCAFCHEQKLLTKDHIIPLSKGGSDFIKNIQPLCKNCNSKKNNKIL